MRHRSTLSISLVVLIGLECCFLFAAFTPSHIDRFSAARAFVEWRQNPSPGTEAAWNVERARLRRDETIFDFVIWTMIVATGAGIYHVARKQRLQV